MKNINPLRTAQREAKKLEKLGPDASCFCCGESDIACLEIEHTVGRNRDPKFKRVVCSNCHLKLEWQRDIAGLTTNGKHKKETAKESFYKHQLLLAADLEETAKSVRRNAEKSREQGYSL